MRQKGKNQRKDKKTKSGKLTAKRRGNSGTQTFGHRALEEGGPHRTPTRLGSGVRHEPECQEAKAATQETDPKTHKIKASA